MSSIARMCLFTSTVRTEVQQTARYETRPLATITFSTVMASEFNKCNVVWYGSPRVKVMCVATDCQVKESKKKKTYNRRDSQMVTHSSTSRPVQCLYMAERTGCPVLTDLWSYVLDPEKNALIKNQQQQSSQSQSGQEW
jgi:hypothetical protein